MWKAIPLLYGRGSLAVCFPLQSEILLCSRVGLPGGGRHTFLLLKSVPFQHPHLPYYATPNDEAYRRQWSTAELPSRAAICEAHTVEALLPRAMDTDQMPCHLWPSL